MSHFGYIGHHLIVAIKKTIYLMVGWCEIWGHLMTHAPGTTWTGNVVDSHKKVGSMVHWILNVCFALSILTRGRMIQVDALRTPCIFVHVVRTMTRTVTTTLIMTSTKTTVAIIVLTMKIMRITLATTHFYHTDSYNNNGNTRQSP